MTSSNSPTPNNSTLALRLADSDETPVLRRLAALDDAPPLQGDVLLALVDGEAVAAVSLSDGRVVANPFVHTEETITLLALRAAQLGRPGGSSRPARRSSRPTGGSSRAPRIPRLRAA